MSGVPKDHESDAEGHDRTSREEFRAQVHARKADLERFKEYIEERGVESGAWRGEIEQRDT